MIAAHRYPCGAALCCRCGTERRKFAGTGRGWGVGCSGGTTAPSAAMKTSEVRSSAAAELRVWERQYRYTAGA